MNEHVHFHCCVIDEVFEPVVAPEEAPSVSFHAALELNAAALVLTPLELIARIAALVPLQGAHRHRAVALYLWAMLRARDGFVWASEIFGHNSRLTLGEARRYFLFRCWISCPSVKPR